MQLIEKAISLDTLKNMAEKMFGQIVKAVVDIEKEIMVVDAEMHSDQIEFDSMINLRTAWGNKTRSIENPKIGKKVIDIASRLVQSC